MKISFDGILHERQAAYLINLLPPSEKVLAEMEAFAAEHNVPISDQETAIFLEITARSANAERVLEVGLAIGYGAIHFLRGMNDNGTVTAIEPNEERIAQTEKYFLQAGLMPRLQIEKGFALDVLPRLEKNSFDLVYLDAVKEEYSAYLDLSLPLLKTGGLVLADNVLWGGQVAGEIREERYQSSTIALREFNQKFINHPQLRSLILPLGDGLGYGVKIC
ncbi:MAG: O-methyltransferase [Pyrinomonadaceae bacterium]